MGRRDLEAPLFSASRHARAGRAQRAAVRWSLEESLEEFGPGPDRGYISSVPAFGLEAINSVAAFLVDSSWPDTWRGVSTICRRVTFTASS